MANAVETYNLTKTFEVRKKEKEGFYNRLFLRGAKNTITAVDHVNLTIPQGEIFGLLGPNGAGKTTTIKMLSTLLIPTEGEANVNGFDVVKEAEHVQGSIGVLMMGERSVYWKLTGRENLEYYSALHYIPPKMWKERIPQLLEFMGLTERGDDLVEKYSSGMKQRLAIARCLLSDPPLLMLDEPTLGLDPAAARSIRETILDLKSKGKTIILTTHYMEEADQLCDRIGIIHQGKIIALDTPENLKAQVKEMDILELEVSNLSPQFTDALKKLPGVEEASATIVDPVVSSGVVRVHSKDSRSVLPLVLTCIEENGVKVSNIKVSKPTLEDVFIKLTGRTIK